MKLGIFFFFFCVSIAFAENTYAQKTLLSVNATNAPISNVLEQVEKQSDFSFVYDDKVVDTNRRVTIRATKQTVFVILEQMFEKTDIVYMVKDKKIILKRKEGIQGMLQEHNTRIITGRVTDKNGDGIIGANVFVTGSTRMGTVTDINGLFTLELPIDLENIIISYIGYISQKINVNGKNKISILLREDTKTLEEVVLVGYGTMKKSNLTGSLSSVSSETIEQVPVQNVTQALQGRAAGVDVSSNIRPGEIGTIRIRGDRSINASNEPLYVVDGVPVSLGIGDINPGDIEFIEILKDASATAIYGSRGANGVILVSTKKGKSGKISVSFEGNFTFDKINHGIYDMMNGAEQFEMMREGYRHPQAKGYYSTPYTNPIDDAKLLASQDPYSWISIKQGYSWNSDGNVQYRSTTTAEKQAWGVDRVPAYSAANVRETDWTDLVSRLGVATNYQVGISAGTDLIKAFISLGYLNQTGSQLGQDYKRYSMTINLDIHPLKWFTIGASLTGTYGVQNYGVSGGEYDSKDLYGMALAQLPYAVPYDDEGNLLMYPGGITNIKNPLLDFKNVINERRLYRGRGNVYAEAEIIKGLKYRVSIGPDYRHYRKGEYQGSESTPRAGGTSYASYSQNDNFNYVIDNLITYNTTISKEHNLDITLLRSLEANRYESSSTSVNDLPYDSQIWYDLSSSGEGKANTYDSDYSRKVLNSYMFRANYGYKDRYLMIVTGRWDGSSVLADNHKWDFFPSVAFAWKLNEESFMKRFDFLSEAKFRFGWGETGNSSIDPYQTAGTLKSVNYAWGSSAATAYAPNTKAISNLKWEKTSQYDLGLDFGFFKNRISGSLNIYYANTKDLLMERTIPVINGSSNIMDNVGKTKNKGIEIFISSYNISNRNFKWCTDLTFAANKEEIVELYGGKNDDVANGWFIGHSISTNYGYEYGGIWQDNATDNAERAKYGSLYAYAGTIKVVDQNKDYKIDSQDRIIRGQGTPKWTGGLTNVITYKGLEFSIFLFSRWGQTIYNATPRLYGKYHSVKADYWTPTNITGKYPWPNAAAGLDDTYIGTLDYQKGSFVRVRNISLSYSFDKSMLKHIGINDCKITAQLINPFLFTGAKNTDPDLVNTDFNNASTRSLSLGFKLGF